MRACQPPPRDTEQAVVHFAVPVFDSIGENSHYRQKLVVHSDQAREAASSFESSRTHREAKRKRASDFKMESSSLERVARSGMLKWTQAIA